MFEKAGVMLEQDFGYKISEMLAVAVMNEEPLLIVEGTDDVEFYKKISGDKVKVRCSEVVKNSERKAYKAGCDGVIQIVKDVQEDLESDARLEKLFLGIVDADYRRFLGEDYPEYRGLFILKYYSYESHFLTDSSIKNFISAVTSVRNSEITDDILMIAKKNVEGTIRNLYYVGLEALRGRKKKIKTIVNYDMKPEALYEKNENGTIIEQILAKKEQLDDFANHNNITFHDYLYIIRGKWLLHMIAKCVYDNIASIKKQCGDAVIAQCDFCKQGMKEKCIWGKRMELKRGQLEHYFIYTNLTEPEIGYIKERIGALGM